MPKPKQVNIYKQWCKKCGICMAFCPKKALEKGYDRCPYWIKEKCNGCKMCQYLCPDLAIVVEK